MTAKDIRVHSNPANSLKRKNPNVKMKILIDIDEVDCSAPRLTGQICCDLPAMFKWRWLVCVSVCVSVCECVVLVVGCPYVLHVPVHTG